MREKFKKSRVHAYRLKMVAYALQARVRDLNQGIQQLVSVTRELEEESKMALRASRLDINKNAE